VNCSKAFVDFVDPYGEIGADFQTRLDKEIVNYRLVAIPGITSLAVPPAEVCQYSAERVCRHKC
jgi:hypothetical protein